jgi:DNA-directed RNA polymerase subunit RPC12/RpoP
MKLITKREVIRDVAKRWREQYEPFKEERPLFSVRNGIQICKTKREIADELDSLDKETASDADVDAIIGNEYWTSMKCDECGQEVDVLIRVGQEPDYGSHTAYLCMPCIRKAFDLSNAEQAR